MKLSAIPLLLVLMVSGLFPQNQQDTIAHRTVGPGVTYTKLVDSLIPWSIDLLRVDLTNPYIKLEAVKALERISGGRELTSAMAARRNFSGHWVVGAVNADFFEANGATVNTHVGNGLMTKRENGWPAFGFNNNNNLSITVPVFGGKVIFRNGSSSNFSDINTARDTGKIYYYNTYYGVTTGTDGNGTEVMLRPIGGWRMNDTVLCVIDSVATGRGSHPLSNHIVLSGAGTTSALLAGRSAKGDTVKLIMNLMPSVKNLIGMVGGRPVIVEDGAVANLNLGDPFVTARHPRTGVGFNADTTTLLLFTVDGRQVGLSAGMNLTEFANLMIRHGVHQGINLDGGGSTAMVVRGEIMNSPSDPGGERSVANALLVISDAPSGSLSHIEIFPKMAKVFAGNSVTFSASATDEYYNPIPIPPGTIGYTLSKPTLGTVTQGGIYTAGAVADTGYLIVSYSGIKDSALIISKALNYIQVVPKMAVTDVTRLLAFTAKAFDTDSVEQVIPQQNYTWTSTDTLVGKIDGVGQFKGLSPGTTRIIARFQNFVDTATVRVEVGMGYHSVDSVESLAGWTVGGDNYDSIYTAISLADTLSSAGGSSLRLDYRFTFVQGMYNYIYLKTDREIFGVPDSILIDVKGDGPSHRIFFDFEDVNGAKYRTMGHKTLSNPNIFETIRATLPKNASVVYPLRLKAVTLVMGSSGVPGNIYTGYLHTDNIRTKYPPFTGVEDLHETPDSFELLQNYPNPFNPNTEISFVLKNRSHVLLKVHDTLGREIVKLADGLYDQGRHTVRFSGKRFASGVYIYTLTLNGGMSISRKMSLLR
ncbi:MAG: hypothetical protein FMNOHCHN_00525 [Ignavibacteriaceae bacterium]|nr:hypothetical protein [Ignavibacteriaceae bacterium]